MGRSDPAIAAVFAAAAANPGVWVSVRVPGARHDYLRRLAVNRAVNPASRWHGTEVAARVLDHGECRLYVRVPEG